jgi:hypothetical protein
MSPAELETEQSIASLRAEVVEVRALLTDYATKLGVAAGTVGFSPDVPVEVMRAQIVGLMGAVPVRNQRTIEAAARWLEKQSTLTCVCNAVENPLATPDSWTRFQPQAAELIAALRK